MTTEAPPVFAYLQELVWQSEDGRYVVCLDRTPRHQDGWVCIHHYTVFGKGAQGHSVTIRAEAVSALARALCAPTEEP